ncbi:unnamed protein product [Bemisia tabaci]|uniref:Uncharacterized protein n=1 Tax=Bemisia tabaci TaxID=7038 RepID=A0A9P0G1B1_BEMTA|nr:unnamed protein product [Bemisia tabaci]
MFDKLALELLASVVIVTLIRSGTCDVPSDWQSGAGSIAPRSFDPKSDAESISPRGPEMGVNGGSIDLKSSESAKERTARDWSTTGSTAGSYYPPSNGYVGGPSYVDSYGVPHSDYQYPNAGASSYSSEEAKPKQRPIVPPIFPPVYQGMPMTPVECQMAGYSNVFGDLFRFGGLIKVGLIKAGLTALAAGLLTKLPLLLFIKTLIVKLIIFPIGFLVFSLPVLLPLLLFFLPNLMKDKQPIMMMMTPENANNSTNGGNKRPGTRDFLYRVSDKNGEKGYEDEYEEESRKSRDADTYLDSILSTIFDSQLCLQRIACQLGVRDADSKYRKSVSWALKYLQTFKMAESSPDIQARLKSYRNAYNLGAEQNSTEFCSSDERFPCETPHIVLRQAKRSITLI